MSRGPITKAALAAALLAVSCAADDPVSSVGVERQAGVTFSACGGCDLACFLADDVPSAPDVVAGDNAECTAFDAGAGGVVLSYTGCPDTDGDGVPDIGDPTPADANGDADGDGVPDAWEVELGTDPLVAGPALPSGTFYTVLPFGGGPVTEVLPPVLDVRVRSADVYFLIDTTMSMTGESSNLKSSIASTIVPGINAMIADAQFGVGQYGDYTPGAVYPFRHEQSITANVAAVQTALNGLTHTSGGLTNWPESAVPALHAVATGGGLPCGVPARSCPGGTIGYPCFRPHALPVVVLITDAAFVNGVRDWLDPEWASESTRWYTDYDYGDAQYSGLSCYPMGIPYLPQVVTELNSIGAKMIGVWSNDWPGDLGHVSGWGWGRTYPNVYRTLDLYYALRETGSVDASGWPFLYGLSTDGSGLGIEIVNAVSDLVDTMLLDVSAEWEDVDPAAPDGGALIDSVSPIACAPPTCTIDAVNDVARDVTPGSDVTFEMTMENSTIPSTPAAQDFEVHVTVLGNDTAVVGEATVHVLVPGTDPVVGTYEQDYDSLFRCAAGEEPLWYNLYYDATLPAGTEIEFFALTAEPPTTLDDPSLISYSLGVAPGDGSPLSVADALPLDDRQLLRIQAELRTTTPGTSPVLHDTTLEFYCVTP